MPRISAKDVIQDQILYLISTGNNITDIAKEIGRSRGFVYRQLDIIGDLKLSEELISIQLKDIEKAPEGLRMLYRDKIIQRLRPIRREDKVESVNQINIRFVD